jgi:glutamyl-tRNA reductase
MEELDAAIRKNIEKRVAEAKKAKEIIDFELEEIWNENIESEQEPAPLP